MLLDMVVLILGSVLLGNLVGLYTLASFLTLLWLGFSMYVKGLGGVKLPPLSKILLKHAMTPLFGMLIKEPMYFQKIYTLTPL